MAFESKADVWPKFDEFTPYSYFELLKQIHSQNTFSQRIHLYNERKGIDQLQPLSTEYLEENKDWLPVQNVCFIKDARETYEAASRASSHVKPILYHYSWHSFFAFLMYTFVGYDSHVGGHGITVSTMDPEEIILEFHPLHKKGYFQRILDTLTILGYPLAFAGWIPITREDQRVVFEENEASTITNRKQINLIEIATFDARDYVDRLAKKYESLRELRIISQPYYGPRFHWINEWVICFAMLFAASTITRYRPYVWAEILQGKNEYTSRILTKVRKAYETYVDFVYYVHSYILEKYK